MFIPKDYGACRPMTGQLTFIVGGLSGCLPVLPEGIGSRGPRGERGMERVRGGRKIVAATIANSEQTVALTDIQPLQLGLMADRGGPHGPSVTDILHVASPLQPTWPKCDGVLHFCTYTEWGHVTRASTVT